MADEGIARRMKTCQMDSSFQEQYTTDNYETKQFIKDAGLGNKLCTTYKYAFMSLIYQYAKKYIDDGYKLMPFPTDWDAATKEVVGDNNKFNDFFHKYFIVEEGAKAYKDDVKQYIDIFTTADNFNLKDELKRMRLPVVYDSQDRNKTAKKGWWIGFRLKSMEEQEGE